MPAPAAIVEEPEPEPERIPTPKAKKQARPVQVEEPEPPARTAKSKKAAKATMRTKTSRLRALRAKIDADDRMSLEEAAELLVPVIEELGQATMQDLEAFTGIGRRKLRFHIGQLVRHDHLQRHGMGRGTYYTAGE
jgi:predicted HTH transcriptional regulator